MVFTGVSTSTVYRRRQELQFQDNVLSVTDSELDTIILDIRMYNPNIGVTLMEGEVRSRGIRASHRRVWEAMRRVDPEGVTDGIHLSNDGNIRCQVPTVCGTLTQITN